MLDVFGEPLHVGDTISVATSKGRGRGEMVRGTITRFGPGRVYYQADLAADHTDGAPRPDDRQSWSQPHLVVRIPQIPSGYYVDSGEGAAYLYHRECGRSVLLAERATVVEMASAASSHSCPESE